MAFAHGLGGAGLGALVRQKLCCLRPNSVIRNLFPVARIPSVLSAHQLYGLPAPEVLEHPAVRALIVRGHVPHAKLMDCPAQPNRRRLFTKRAAGYRAPDSLNIAGTPVPTLYELDLPE